MAKLIKKDGSITNCKVLNESKDKYVIELNGKRGSVFKNRVFDLNRVDESAIEYGGLDYGYLDEGLGDVAKAAGRGLKKFGTAVKNMVVNFVKPILDKGFVRFLGMNGAKLSVSHPVNMYKIAQNADFAEIYPSKALMKAASRLNSETGSDIMESVIVENEYTLDDYAPDFTIRENGTFYRVNEEISPKDLIQLKTTAYSQISTEDMQKLIWNQWMSTLVEPGKRQNVYCFFGAPGVGKTSIIRYIFKSLYKRSGYKFTFTPINAAYLRDDSLTIPGYSANGIKAEEKPMQFLPVWSKYDIDKLVYGDLEDTLMGSESGDEFAMASAHSVEGDERMAKVKKVKTEAEAIAILDGLANGDVYDRHGNKVVEGMGGLLFIDEFVRVKQEVVNQIMTLLSDREIGVSGFTLGSRWIVVMASNRVKADMGGSDSAKLNVDAASVARIIPYELQPDLKSWIQWAEESDAILPEIISFLKKKGNAKYFYFNALSSVGKNKEFATKEIPYATPRRWENLTISIRERFFMADKINAAASKVPIINILKNDPDAKGYFEDTPLSNLSEVDPIKLAATVEACMGVEVAKPFLDFLEIEGLTAEEAKHIYEGTWMDDKAKAFTEPVEDFSGALKSLYASKIAEVVKPYMTKERFIKKDNWINILDFFTSRMFNFKFSDYLRDFYDRTPEGDIIRDNDGNPSIVPIKAWCNKNSIDISYLQTYMTTLREGIQYMMDCMVEGSKLSRKFYQNSDFDDINNVNSPVYEYNDVNDALREMFKIADENFSSF